jgi:hypothetical protein
MFKTKPLLDIFKESNHNITYSSPIQTPIDQSKVDSEYNNYIKENLPEMRPIGKYWGGSKSSNLIDFQVGGTKVFVDRNLADTKRIKDFMTSKKGVLWNIKQTGLQLMNPKVESIIPLIIPTRIYNPIKLMANVIGLHIERHGLVGDGNYSDVMKIKNNSETYRVTNRLLQLYSELKMDTVMNSIIGNSALLNKVVSNNPQLSNFLGKANNLVNKAKDIYNKFTNVKIFNVPIGDFLGTNDNYNKRKLRTLSGINGPNSIYGVGTTNIYSYQNGNKADLKYTDKQGNETAYGKYSYNTPYNKDNSLLQTLAEQNYNSSKVISGEPVGKGLQPGNNGAGGNSVVLSDIEGLYNTYQSISTFQGKKWTNWESTKYKNEHVDEFFDAYSGVTVTSANRSLDYNPMENYNSNWNYFKRLGIPDVGKNNYDVIYGYNDGNDKNTILGADDAQDFVKLRIGGIQFRCTIEGVNRGFTANWGTTKYIGRPDDVYSYEGFSQDISFSFIVAANSKVEMAGIYSKLNRLIQLASPTISTNGLMSGQIVDLKIGMWFSESVGKGLPVKINSVTVSVEAEHTWDIIKELPMMFKVDIACDVIGNKIPSNNTIYFGNSSSNITDGVYIADDNNTTVPEQEKTPTDYGSVSNMVDNLTKVP